MSSVTRLAVKGVVKGGPGRAQTQMFVASCHSRSVYSNRTVKYSNKQPNTLLKQSADQIVPYQVLIQVWLRH